MASRRGTIALLAAGVLFVLVPAILLAFPARPLPVPPSLAGLPAHGQLVGPEAAREIGRLHDRWIPMRAAAVAVYGQGNAVLWVSDHWIPPVAAALERRMIDRIAHGTTPFRVVGRRQVGTVQFHELEGLGQTHYLFRVGARLYWLAADPNLATAALADLVAFALDSDSGR